MAILAADTAEALAAQARLVARWGQYTPESADVIVALGGDGFLLETLHRCVERKRPIYGMNCGSVGFLLNDFQEEDLAGRVAAA
ncbi:NAD(+)/NADH kinase, partial [Inquilinus sp.]|uniref:NAD(+)/NADH kinase n=1 Tax=Inquilinus sp. TaxID=1932117 RepID=UPI0031D24D81